jgi:hypothetical protein
LLRKKQCLDAIISGLVANEVAEEKKEQVGIPDAIFCDPDTICNGTINNAMNLTPLPSTLLSFPFTCIGPDCGPFVIKSDTLTADPFTHAFTGPGGTVRILAPDYNNPDWPVPPESTPDKPVFYEVDQISVTRLDGTAVGEPFVTLHTCSGGYKGPAELWDLEGTYNFLWHLHKSRTAGILCE